MDSENNPDDVLIVYENEFDKSIHDFEKFAREVFNGSNENEKTRLHKKLEEFLTFKDHYKKKADSEKLENILTQSRKRQMTSLVDLNSKKRKPEPMELFDVPNEIWLKIMSYLKFSDVLKNFNLVCKHFNHLSLDSSAIKYIQLKGIKDRKLYNQAVTVLKRCKTIREINVYNCHYLRDLSSHIFKSSAGLRKLKMEGMEIYPNALHNSKLCQGLQRIEFINMNIADKTLLGVAQIKTLKYLKLHMCVFDGTNYSRRTVIMKNCIKELVENCKQFEELHLDLVTDLDLQDICKLKALKSFKFSRGALNAKQIEALARCDHLESINLTISETDMTKIASALNTLFMKHRLSLKKIKIDKQSMAGQNHIALLNNLILCENLEEIAVNMFNFCKSDIESVFQLPTLKRFAINQLACNFLRELRRTIVTNNLMANLEEFEGSCDVFRTTDPQLIFQMPKLRILKLFDDPWVLSKSKRLVLEQMNCPSLERLIINFNSQYPFNVDVLSSLLKQFPNLRSIQVFSFSNIELPHDYLYTIIKQYGIFIFWGSRMTEGKNVEEVFRRMDEEFYFKYLEMKKKYFDWLEHHDWPSSWTL